jgi:hypothetical protein
MLAQTVKIEIIGRWVLENVKIILKIFPRSSALAKYLYHYSRIIS